MSRLDRFLFAPVASAPVAGFRVAFAVVLLAAFWPEGRQPIGSLARLPGAAALWDGVFLTHAYWALCVAALVAFAAAVGGRASAAAAAILLLPLTPLRGALSHQVLLFSLLAFSLLRQHRRPLPGQTAGPIWPLRLIQIQLSALYAVNAWAKLTPAYLSGEVLVGLSRVMPNFLADLSDGFLHLGPLAVPVSVCAIGTVAIEAALAVGFWIPRLRLATAALGVGFHLSLQWVLEIGWLDWTCMFLYLAFLLPFERAPTQETVASPSPVGLAPGR